MKRSSALFFAAAARVSWVWGCVFLMLIMAAPAWGLEIKGEMLSVGIGGLHGRGGRYRMGNWVPVHVRLSSDEQVEICLAVEQQDIDGDRFTCYSRPITLSPSSLTETSRDVWMYYWPSPDDPGKGITSVVVTGKNHVPLAAVPPIMIPNLGPRKELPANETPGISHWGDSDEQPRFVVVLGKKPMGLNVYNEARGGNARTHVQQITQADQLPDQAIGLEGVDTIVWNTNDVPPTQMAAEFQRKALLEWVRAGGHLVMVTGDGWQDLQAAANSDPAFGQLLPMALESTRTLANAEIFDLYTPGAASAGIKDLAGPFTQIIGTMKENGRVIGPHLTDIDASRHPLVVMGPCGAGDITLITVDLNAAAFDRNGFLGAAMPPYIWLYFWQKTNGWRGKVDPLETIQAEKTDPSKNKEETPLASVYLGRNIPGDLDTKEETQIRILLAVLFLGIYWAVAGPVGHAALKYYKRTHWSWWAFSGVVIVAAGIATGTVFLMRITAYDVRHCTYVCGTVNDKDASVTAFYGVLAPSSGNVRLELPAGGTAAYLSPLNEQVSRVQGFTNPRRYQLETADLPRVDVPFRQTLKKMQARWNGTLGGITGEAHIIGGNERPLTGALQNHTGYTLENVSIVWTRPGLEATDTALSTASIAVFREPWHAGETLDLGRFEQDAVGKDEKGREGTSEPLADLLDSVALNMVVGHGVMSAMSGHSGELKVFEDRWNRDYGEDLLSLFAETINPALPTRAVRDIALRYQLIRSFTRPVERTAALRANGAVLIARAGRVDDSHRNYVPAPLRLRVDNRLIEGKGQVIFAYGLPIRLSAPSTPVEKPTTKP